MDLIFIRKKGNDMSLIGILIIIVIALLVVMLKLVVDGVKTKNWKKVIVTAVIFCTIFAMLYFALVRFITAM